jgi:hypothetical protein
LCARINTGRRREERGGIGKEVIYQKDNAIIANFLAKICFNIESN